MAQEDFHPLDDLDDHELRELQKDVEEERRQRDKTTKPTSVMHITSMPVDPLAADFGARINRIRPQDLDRNVSACEQDLQYHQGELWEDLK